MSDSLKRIEALVELGRFIESKPPELEQIISVAQQYNGWFDQRNCWDSLYAISTNYLNQDQLERYVEQYSFPINFEQKRIGLILAGNIPLVGFHDILCVYLSGHLAKIKLSSKDNILTKAIVMKLQSIAPDFAYQLELVEDRLTDFDAVIATGSNNSSRYFEEYFGKYPNIIRKNRTSVAILNGAESQTELSNLTKDIFTHYGLGCRNVSYLLVPEQYDFGPLLEQCNEIPWVIQNTKYKNNYDYNLSVLLINKVPHLQADNLLITENKDLHARIATLHYSTVQNRDEINNFIIEHQESLQVVIGQDFTPFGEAQQPKLWDYADNVDTMKFLIELGTK